MMGRQIITVRGDKRTAKVGEGCTGWGVGVCRNRESGQLEVCTVNDGDVFTYKEITAALDEVATQRPAFVTLVRKSIAVTFEWRRIIHNVITGEVTPDLMSAYSVNGGCNKTVITL